MVELSSFFELQNDLKRKDDELSRQNLFITQLNGQIDFLEQENDNLQQQINDLTADNKHLIDLNIRSSIVKKGLDLTDGILPETTHEEKSFAFDKSMLGKGKFALDLSKVNQLQESGNTMRSNLMNKSQISFINDVNRNANT